MHSGYQSLYFPAMCGAHGGAGKIDGGSCGMSGTQIDAPPAGVALQLQIDLIAAMVALPVQHDVFGHH